jgi:hypothetical protein
MMIVGIMTISHAMRQRGMAGTPLRPGTPAR